MGGTRQRAIRAFPFSTPDTSRSVEVDGRPAPAHDSIPHRRPAECDRRPSHRFFDDKWLHDDRPKAHRILSHAETADTPTMLSVPRRVHGH